MACSLLGNIIFSVDTENAYNKNTYPFMSKILNNVGIGRYFYRMVKIHISNKKPMSSLMVKSQKYFH